MTAWARCRRSQTFSSLSHALTDVHRFVLTSIDGIKGTQSRQAGDVDKEMENLNKKLHYLETTYNNAQMHMEQIFKGRGG